MLKRFILSAAVVLSIVPTIASAQTIGGRGRAATLLDIFPLGEMTCGRRGWTFPGLINGHVPVTACVLKFGNRNRFVSPFGSL